MFLDLGGKDRPTVRRSIEFHEKKLEDAVKRIQLLERSDMDLKTQQGRLEVLKKDFELMAHGAGPIDVITMQLTHPLRMCLATGLRILRYETRKLGDRSELLIGTSEEAQRELDHIDRLLSSIGEQTALELGYVSDKPVEITKDGIADVRAAVQKGIDEGDAEVVSPKGNKWNRRKKRGKENHLRAAAAPEKQSAKKRERGVVKEQKKRERDVLDENRRNINEEAP